MDLVKLIGIFIIIVILIQRKINIGIAMCTSAILLGIVFHVRISEMIYVLFYSVVEYSTIKMIVLFILIMILENIMRKKEILITITNSLKVIIGDYRFVMPILPAFMGLLPSAGGAMFTAPLVEDACEDESISPERKSIINYWYRHIWECLLPLFPSLIIVVEVLGVDLISFMGKLYPFPILTVILGLPYLLYGTQVPEKGLKKRNVDRKYYIDLLKGISPILVILILFFVIRLDIVISILAVVISLLVIYRYSWRSMTITLKEAISFKTIFLVLGAMIFKNMLMATGVIDRLPILFDDLGVPEVLVIMALPFIVGFSTGLSQAFAAIAFPVLLGLSAQIDLGLMALGFVCGYVGVMLSPMHLCLILTVNYFKAKLEKVLVMMTAPLALLVGFGYLLYAVF